MDLTQPGTKQSEITSIELDHQVEEMLINEPSSQGCQHSYTDSICLKEDEYDLVHETWAGIKDQTMFRETLVAISPTDAKPKQQGYDVQQMYAVPDKTCKHIHGDVLLVENPVYGM